MEQEVWKDIPDYEGIYQASSMGRIRSASGHLIFQRAHESGIINGRRQLPYLQTALNKNGKQKFFKVHRLIAAAFLGPIPKGMVVMHNDDDPQNNRISNLKYGTQTKNQKDCYERGRRIVNQEAILKMAAKAKEKNMRKVKAFNIQTEKTIVFDGVREAERKLQIPSSNISEACRGKRKRCKNYRFNYI